MLKILFVGGGSIGHIAPAVAVWEACKKLQPNLEAHFVCSPRPDDTKFLQENHLPFSILDAPRAGILFPLKMIGAIKHAKRILDEQHPDIIFSKGSYISLPLCIAAKKRGIPIVLHDSDAVSGRANRIVEKWAAHICTGFPIPHTPYSISHSYTGNPIRKNVIEGSKTEGLRITGFDGHKPILLVIGGSQGAQAINDSITAQLEDLLLRCDIIHISGRGKSQVPALPAGRSKLKSQISPHYYQTEFANAELPHFYAACDIAISRAGAGSITELAANGIPTILVPLRNVGHDHQFHNATIAAKYGCITLEQATLAKTLLPTVHSLLENTQQQKKMATQFQKFYTPDAAIQIADIVVKTLDKSRRDE